MHKQQTKRNVAIHFAVLGPICWKVVVIAGTSYGDLCISRNKKADILSLNSIQFMVNSMFKNEIAQAVN